MGCGDEFCETRLVTYNDLQQVDLWDGKLENWFESTYNGGISHENQAN